MKLIKIRKRGKGIGSTSTKIYNITSSNKIRITVFIEETYRIHHTSNKASQ